VVFSSVVIVVTVVCTSSSSSENTIGSSITFIQALEVSSIGRPAYAGFFVSSTIFSLVNSSGLVYSNVTVSTTVGCSVEIVVFSVVSSTVTVSTTVVFVCTSSSSSENTIGVFSTLSFGSSTATGFSDNGSKGEVNGFSEVIVSTGLSSVGSSLDSLSCSDTNVVFLSVVIVVSTVVSVVCNSSSSSENTIGINSSGLVDSNVTVSTVVDSTVVTLLSESVTSGLTIGSGVDSKDFNGSRGAENGFSS
ncbi:hypothetical protein CVS40_7113, partial [Lucilia cuprina]